MEEMTNQAQAMETAATAVSTTAEAQPNEAAQESKEAARTYTLDEVQKMIQSETDRRTTQALKKQAKEYEKKLSLSQLDENERGLAERDQRIAELEEALRQGQLERNQSELIKTLAGRKLPVELAECIDISDDVESNQQKVDRLDKAFRAAVEAAVRQRLSGKTPSAAASQSGDAMTRDQFRRLSLMELQKLATEQPELYKQLTGKK